MTADNSKALQQEIQNAVAEHRRLEITGAGSKSFLGRRIVTDTRISTLSHHGIMDYQPTELVVRVRTGTALSELEDTLRQANQCLPFEPPRFGNEGTVGGMVASGLAGPARPFSGGVRDFILGASLINGRGQVVEFGGQVMKNVAGYDLSRLQCGAFGSFGLLLDLSIKTIPLAEREVTVVCEMSQASALDRMAQLRSRPLPLSGAAWLQGKLLLRFSGQEHAVAAAVRDMPGEVQEHTQWWQDLRHQRLAFFESGNANLWRLSLPIKCPSLTLAEDEEELIDWAGMQRWLLSTRPPAEIFAMASEHGGHATLFRPSNASDVIFQELDPSLLKLHQKLKKAFDPQNIFNPTKIYAEL